MPEIIDRILKTQDVNNRRVFAGDPNGNVYGAAGSTCQDTVSGVLYVATRDGMNDWQPLATVAQATPTSSVMAFNPSGLMAAGDWIVIWSPVSPDDAVYAVDTTTGERVFYVINPQNVTKVAYNDIQAFTVSVQPLRNLEDVWLYNSGLTETPAIDGLQRLYNFDINATSVTTWPAITNLPNLHRIDVGNCINLTGSVDWPAGSIPLLDDVQIWDMAAMTSSDMDSVFISIERASLASNGQIDATNSPAPTAASLAARNALIARGWTIVL